MLAWAIGVSAVGVTLSAFVGEGAVFIAVASVLVGVGGALAHSALLRAAWFRRLGGSRVIVIAATTLGLVAFPIAWFGAAEPFNPMEFLQGAVEVVVFFTFPTLLAAFLVSLFIERAGT